MSEKDFSYKSPAGAGARLALGLSIFADRGHVRDLLREDAEAAGFQIVGAAGLADLFEADEHPLGEVVLVDCPLVDPAQLAGLARLDLWVAEHGAQLIISTTVEALDDVFACLDQCGPQILVDPSRAERVIALGRTLAKLPDLRLRELSEEDRLVLLRLTEQIGQIAQRLERLEAPEQDLAEERLGAFRFASPDSPFTPPSSDGSERLVRPARLALPDPRLVRRIIRQRQLRARFFDPALFADPAWDMLLDLFIATGDGKRVPVTSACIGAAVPTSTALRWITQMEEAGLVERQDDNTDRRRAFIVLSDSTMTSMARYFEAIGPRGNHPV